MPDDSTLSACEREPIHRSGAIQAHGALVAFELATLEIAFVSANADAIFGRAPQSLIGMPLSTILSPALIHDVGNALQASSAIAAPERIGPFPLGPNATSCIISAHIAGSLGVCEATPEPGSATAREASTLVRAVSSRLKRAARLDRFLQAAAQQVRAVTGYDRVMIYKFRHDQSGVVVAEALRAGMPPFMGLHYPASDIPGQARALLKRQTLRQIPDVDYVPAPILPLDEGAGAPLDLSLSILRSVSPVHLQYLRNMGSRATLTVSIMRGDDLWGLVACHHETPRLTPNSTGAALELFAQLFAFQLEAREQAEELQQVACARGAHEALLARLASDAPLFDDLPAFAAHIRAMIACDGVGLWRAGAFTLDGSGPSPEAMPEIVRHVQSLGGDVFSSDELGSVVPDAMRDARDASGLLAISLGGASSDLLLLFRAEQVRDVMWGGDPHKAVEAGAHGVGPRRSFAAWREVTRGRSLPWRPADLQIAAMLRVSLLDAILRRARLEERARREAHESQTLLVAELNHRVKNIIALTRSLVRQSQTGADSIEQFTQTVDQRLAALARAHDQSSQANWGSTSLRRLLETEVAVWGGVADERIELVGPPLTLTRRALMAISLVTHELMTNSAKYGAISNDVGVVSIAWRRTEEGDVAIRWRERGGPPVAAPTRRGFGSTVIQQTLAFELGGSSELRYPPSGLEADFRIPAAFAQTGDPNEARVAPVAQAPPDLAGRRLLVVEDSMMIALDTQGVLERCGAEVEIASNVADARKALQAIDFSGAVLDVNLYGETSFAIADDLAARGVPFVFASGFGDSAPLPARFKSCAVMGKPFDGADLAKHLFAMAAPP